MLPIESKWLNKHMLPLLKDGGSILNIGASTKKYVMEIEPHIYKNILEPITKKEISFINVDIKNAEGVDIVADILNEDDREKIKNNNYQNILCSNVLEHVSNIRAFCEALNKLLPYDGNLIVTVPCRYPYHEDPIDTMFRPTLDKLTEFFPQLKLVFGEIVDCGTVKEYEKYKRKINPKVEYIMGIKSFIKQLMPFYKYDQWKKNQIKKRDFKADVHYLVTCAIFRNEV